MPALTSLVGASSRLGFSTNARDLPVCVVDDAAEGRRIVDPDQMQHAHAALASRGSAIIARRSRLVSTSPLSTKNGPLMNCCDVLEGAGGAERRLFDDVADRQTEPAAVAEIRLIAAGR